MLCNGKCNKIDSIHVFTDIFIAMEAGKTIWEYLDYREMLRDYYELRKSSMPLFSYRMLGNHMGMDASQAFRVLKGELLLPERSIADCVSMLGLKERESEYFELLVRFARARTDRDRKSLFEEILSMRETPEHRLSAKQYRLFAEWHVVAVRALLGTGEFRDDWDLIASCLTPSISPKQAKEAVELLIDLGLVKHVKGVFTLTEKHLSTERTVSNLAVRSFHHETLRLADESLERHPKDQREFGTLTMAIDDVCYRDIADILAECRKQIRKRVDEVKNPDRVVQCNMQVFPMAYKARKQ